MREMDEDRIPFKIPAKKKVAKKMPKKKFERFVKFKTEGMYGLQDRKWSQRAKTTGVYGHDTFASSRDREDKIKWMTKRGRPNKEK